MTVTLAAPAHRGRVSMRLQLSALATMNLVNGAMFASWFPYVATVATTLGLSNLALSRALLGLPAWLLLGALSTRWLIPRMGPGVVASLGIMGYCAGMALPGRAPNAVMLGSALAAPGFFNGWLDPALTELGNELEAARDGRLQGRLQAALTAGGLGATVVAPLAIAHHVSARHYLLAVAAAGLPVAVLASVVLLTVRRAARRSTAASRPTSVATEPLMRPRWLLAICGLAVAGYVAEGAFGDWHGLFLRGVGASPSRAEWAYTLFALCEMVSRVASDRLVAKVGARGTVVAAGVVALLGAVSFVSAHTVLQGLVGAAVLGAGIGPIVPLALSAVGTNKGSVMWVATCGYLGLSAGPPAIGFVAHARGLRFALGALVVLGIAVILLSGAVRPRVPLAGMQRRYGRTRLGDAFVRLRLLVDAVATARARLRLTPEAVGAGVAPLTVAEVRRPKVVEAECEAGAVTVAPQRASAVRRRRNRSTMLAFMELGEHLLALEVVKVGMGPRRFVVWNIADESGCVASIFEHAGDALLAFEAALVPEWERIRDDQKVRRGLAALPDRVDELCEKPPRRAPLRAFVLEGKVPKLKCPDGDALQRSNRATALRLLLPGGEVAALQWVCLSRRSTPQLALFDSRQAGGWVEPFTGDPGEQLVARLETLVERPYWQHMTSRRTT
jgi:MFS family permease